MSDHTAGSHGFELQANRALSSLDIALRLALAAWPDSIPTGSTPSAIRLAEAWNVQRQVYAKTIEDLAQTGGMSTTEADALVSGIARELPGLRAKALIAWQRLTQGLETNQYTAEDAPDLDEMVHNYPDIVLYANEARLTRPEVIRDLAKLNTRRVFD